MEYQDKKELINKITTFINDIGLECVEGELPSSTFLPGMHVENGRIIYGYDQVKFPGDLIHEAGHLAVILPDERKVAGPENISGSLDPGGAELAAIAWSWAALQHLQLAPELLFHDEGYKGGASSLIENFSAGRYIGVPMLQWLGLTKEAKNDVEADEFTYPKMKNWLRSNNN
jgi:hypothetical protein